MTGHRYPSVSCIMPTADRPDFIAPAARAFLAQDYPNRELLVLDDGIHPVADQLPSDPRIRYIREDRRTSLGAKRNRLCAEARGEVIVHWDDDDWPAPWRITYQVLSLAAKSAQICGVDRPLFYNSDSGEAWCYEYPADSPLWIYGATFCFRRSVWEARPFPELDVGEDNRFIWNRNPMTILALPDNRCLIARLHAGNTSPKLTGGLRWRRIPAGPILELLTRWGAELPAGKGGPT
jgi:glycosyltransferase involved in cell wall biosynthesis